MVGSRPYSRGGPGALALAALLALATCNPDPNEIRPKNNGGVTGGSGGSGGNGGNGGIVANGGTLGGGDPVRQNEICEVTGMALCRRVMECGFGPAVDCFQRFRGGCCLKDNTCNDVLAGDPQALRGFAQRCADAFLAEACPDVMKTVVPQACGGM